MSETLRKLLKARKKDDLEINKKNQINELANLSKGNRMLSLDIGTVDPHIIYEEPDGKRYYQKIIFI